MPIYEYMCNDCGEVFEAIQKFSDKPLKKCKHCGGKKVEKLISQSSFILKGGGWYKDGYSSGGDKKIAKKEAPKTDAAKGAPKPDCKGCPSAQG